jgi:hypothetical protein
VPRPLARLATRLATPLLTLLFALPIALATPAEAQEPAPGITEIEFVTVEGSPGPAFYSRGAVTLRVAGEDCLTHEFTDDNPSPVVRLGGPDQSAVCSTAGDYIRFYRALGFGGGDRHGSTNHHRAHGAE